MVTTAAISAVSGFTTTSSTTTTTSALSMIEEASSYTNLQQKVDIAPPPMKEPEETNNNNNNNNAFFASPDAENTMDIQMAASSEVQVKKTRKIAKFQVDDGGNGIMMETNKPFPTVHAVKPLSVVSPKKAVLAKQGIMMASKPDRSVPKGGVKTKVEPSESSTTVPNHSTFKWRPAAVTPDGKIEWQQREIDCMIKPAE